MLRQKSFQVLDKYWVRSVQRGAPENAAIVVVGNKSDLTDDREVTTEEGREFAEKHQAIFMEVSAKTGDRVLNLFQELGKCRHQVPGVP